MQSKLYVTHNEGYFSMLLFEDIHIISYVCSPFKVLAGNFNFIFQSLLPQFFKGLPNCLWTCRVPPLDIGNRVTVGRPRTYRDREKSAFGFNVVLPNYLKPVGVVQIHGQQTDITKYRNVLMMQLKCFIFLQFLIYSKLTAKLTTY